jgi:hypothetical protein
LNGLEVYSYFRKHLGPRFAAAGIMLQFHSNQIPGIHFKAVVSEEFKEGIRKGILEGLSFRFPELTKRMSVWVTEVTEHPVDSSERAFYMAAHCAIEQAYLLTQTMQPLPASDRGTSSNL